MVNTGKRRADGPLGEGVRFVAVARMEDRVVVAAYTHGSSSRDQLYTDVLHKVIRSQKTVTDNPRLTITDREVGTVHYDTDRSAIFVAITAFEYPQRTAFKCLGDLRTRFQASFGEALHKSAEGGLSKPARQILADVCNTFEDPAAVDKTLGVLRQVEDLLWLDLLWLHLLWLHLTWLHLLWLYLLWQVEEVKGIMHDSINEMLATRDNLEVLEDKTETLRSEAATFQRQAVTLKRSMWWRNMKLKLLCGFLILIVLGYVFLPMLANLPGVQQGGSDSGGGASGSDEPSEDEGASNSTALRHR